MRPIAPALLCLLLAAPAAASPVGAYLAWTDCDGGGGLHTVSFACNTNSSAAAHVLVASFVAPAGITQFIGGVVTLQIQFDGTTVPPWWLVRGTGQCRNGAASATADFLSGPYSCADPWQGTAAGGIASYNVGFGAPNRVRVQLAFAMPNSSAIPLTEGQEYYDFRMTLLNTKTVGTGSCSGCDVAAALGLVYLELDQVTGTAPPVVMSGPQFVTDRSTAGWQCPAAFSWTCDGTGCSFDLHPTCATPALRSTWGAIKAFYR